MRLPEAVVSAYRPDVAQMKLVARSVSPDGITHLAYNQTLDGLESYDSGLDAHVTRDGRLITVNDRTVRGASCATRRRTVTALAGLGEARLETGGLALPPSVTKSGRATTFSTGEAAKLRWYATEDGARLAWDVFTDGEDGDMFSVVVDAETGDTLESRSLTSKAGLAAISRTTRTRRRGPDHDAAVLVRRAHRRHAALGPVRAHVRRPQRPGPGDPAPRQAERACRSPRAADPWTPRLALRPPARTSRRDAVPAQRLLVELRQPRDQGDQPVPGLDQRARAHQPLPRVSGQPPIGFDEASGNFQRVNTSGAGKGNDYVEAEINDGQGLNNANFGTPADGSAPRMQMFLFTASTPTAATPPRSSTTRSRTVSTAA